jgi:hypothetical protein
VSISAIPPFGVPADAVEPWRRLTQAIVDNPPPCSGAPETWWTLQTVEEAVAACAECRVLQLCRDYADRSGEMWGVWGGRDRDQRRVAEQETQ